MADNKYATLQAFAKIEFHVSDAPEEDGGSYLVAAFGSDDTLSAMADLLSFDEFNEFDKMDNAGNVSLSDNGCPFEDAQDAIKTLVEVFKIAIEEGLITETALRAQCQVWPYGVDRSVFSS